MVGKDCKIVLTNHSNLQEKGLFCREKECLKSSAVSFLVVNN